MIGLSTMGSISLGCALVAGKNRVPRPAAGNTALRTLIAISDLSCAAGAIYWGDGLILLSSYSSEVGMKSRIIDEFRMLIGGRDYATLAGSPASSCSNVVICSSTSSAPVDLSGNFSRPPVENCAPLVEETNWASRV